MNSQFFHVLKYKKSYNNLRLISRKLSKYLGHDVSAKSIRKRFLDYFIEENGHKFVKSSPVVPLYDPTVSFVNAGMNQFKGVFLGTQTPKFGKVANSQKCIRISGKHNDLNVIGTDGYHHTFFEMLGNWSFGEYFKEDACKLAWALLTDVYKIPKEKLYVTYFSGDQNLGLSADQQTKEIWREIGVPENRILPFGVQDNFWEMGATGPCGPCTEIHVDLTNSPNRAQFVNKGLNDLTELWNIVFIQYNRNPDGTVSPLPKQHVDTGMGFERLTSLLQGKISNYDTDNFDYIMKAIHENCRSLPAYSGHFGEDDKSGLDTAYRILADHVRMITVALADGVIPEQNQKLRRVMRKSFLLSENVFKKDYGLVRELTNSVVENLGSFYPEMERNIAQVQQIINYEEDTYKAIRLSAQKDWNKLIEQNPKLSKFDLTDLSPSFIQAYKEVSSKNLKEIDGPLAYYLYDTHGLDEEVIEKLARNLDLKFDPKKFESAFEKVKLQSKENSSKILDNNAAVILSNIPQTDDSYKYLYTKSNKEYIFKAVDVKILGILKNNELVNELRSNTDGISLILDKTNMYSKAGGQSSDKGHIKFKNGEFFIENTQNINNTILHIGYFNGTSLKSNSKGTISVDAAVRLRNMRNHTSTHLLNATVKKVKMATCQKSSKVTDSCLVFDVAVFGEKLTLSEIKSIENEINKIIENGCEVRVKEIDSQELYEFDNITLIPGEIYPENNIRLIEIMDKNGDVYSREPCCGTHVLNTSDIDEFSIISVKSLGRSTSSITAVTGERAKLARKNAEDLEDEIIMLQKTLGENIDKPQILDMAVSALRRKTKFDVNNDDILPLCKKQELLQRLEMISKQIKDTTKENLRDFIEMEMQNALESNIRTTKTNKKYMVHYLRSSMILESVPLQRATKLCPDIPVLVISYSDSMVKARCCVPKEFVTENFTAEKWLKETVAKVFNARVAPPRGQSASLTCNMREKRVHLQEWDPLLTESLEEAEDFVKRNL